ncbi:unnamed protein product, partial [Choristocarpus tenellus]
MPTFDINGTDVDFPFQPYDCQFTYMRSVMEALNTPTNALLESPTGTGKTLCLLCSTLAWQFKASLAVKKGGQKGSLAYEDPGQAPPLPQTQSMPVGVPTIIYSSRTHSQLAQVVKELKNTTYRPRLSLLGSREQLCVHDDVRRLKGQAMNHACGALVSGRQCKYHRGTEAGPVVNTNQNQVVDIEELVSLAKTHQFCPYYHSRGEAPQAELVLMPYNYLLDPNSRRGVKV